MTVDSDESKRYGEPAALQTRSLDVNTAIARELVEIAGITPAIAAEILVERGRGEFASWTDLVNRVVGLSSAKAAVLASMGGLTVDGNSLPGAPPDPTLAAAPR